MAVLLQYKSKVRPVMDFRKLNCYVDVFTQMFAQHNCVNGSKRVPMYPCLTLRGHIFRVCVQKTLWPFQTKKIGGKRYCLTHLGFGLNVALLIMKAIVSTVLSQEEVVHHVASA